MTSIFNRFRGIKTIAPLLILAATFSAGASAQSNSTGILAGLAAPGETVVVQNPKTGFKRTIAAGKNGKYRVSSLPIGVYVVTITHADGTRHVSEPASVRIGLTTQVK
jgi:hypothetical protein